jgi:hypothetical protein
MERRGAARPGFVNGDPEKSVLPAKAPEVKEWSAAGQRRAEQLRSYFR